MIAQQIDEAGVILLQSQLLPTSANYFKQAEIGSEEFGFSWFRVKETRSSDLEAPKSGRGLVFKTLGQKCLPK